MPSKPSTKKLSTKKPSTNKRWTNKRWTNKRWTNKRWTNKRWTNKRWTNKRWTSERIDLLREMWAQGKNATAIAAQLGGVSRAAVLGKVFRLRLGPPRGEQRPRADEPELSRRDSGRPAKALEVEKRGKTLLELDNQSCRWPIGEPGTPRFRYCGQPGADLENGCPYCEQHMRRAYVGYGKGAAASVPAEEPDRAVKTKSPSIVPATKQQIVAKTQRRRA
jgi:GcrA cell cycle regulator